MRTLHLLLIGLVLGTLGCNPKGACEHTSATGTSGCADVNKKACAPIGKLVEGKTCKDLGYKCDKYGNNCHK